MEQGYSPAGAQEVALAALLCLFIVGCNMRSEQNRPLELLRNAGIVVHEEVVANATPIPHSRRAWAFSAAEGRLGLWLYEFEGQDDIDSAMLMVEETLINQHKALDFAQNGEFLLVVFLGPIGEMLRDRQAASRILQAFSGEVER